MTTATKKKETRGRKLKTYFDGKELRDATMGMSIPVLPMDLAAAEAVRSDDVNGQERFRECLVAQACNRVFGADAKVAIMRRTAWVSLPGEKHAYRYIVPAETYALVSGFDKGEPPEVGTMVTLIAPSKGRTLLADRKRTKAYRKRTGVHGNVRLTDRKRKIADPLHGVIRNGNYIRL